jgi:hypothetical protein
MSIKSIPDLKTQINTLLPDNSAGAISAADVRTNMIDAADSLAPVDHKHSNAEINTAIAASPATSATAMGLGTASQPTHAGLHVTGVLNAGAATITGLVSSDTASITGLITAGSATVTGLLTVQSVMVAGSNIASSAAISWNSVTNPQPDLTLAHNTMVTVSNLPLRGQASLSGIVGGSGSYSLDIEHAGLTVEVMGGLLTDIATLAVGGKFEISIKRNLIELRVWISTKPA